MTGIDLTPGETEILIDGLSDDVAFVWILIHLGIRKNPPPTPDWHPSEADIGAAFASLQKLVDAGLVRVGRLEYVDGGPPGRVAPVKHVVEPLAEVRGRVEESVLTGPARGDWELSCWLVNTKNGDARAHRALDQQSSE